LAGIIPGHQRAHDVAAKNQLMSRPRLIALLLALTTLLVYLPVTRSSFTNYDDQDYVTENHVVQGGLTLDGIKWAFVTGHASNWHPLTWLSHMADCAVFGLNPAAHHFVNALFHAVNAALLFVLLLRLTGRLWPCAFIAALFAWHPLHVESVAWVAERKDVLSTFFALLALLSYVKHVELAQAQSPKSRVHFALSLLFFALGLMAKPMLVTLPFILLLLDFWPLQRMAGDKWQVTGAVRLVGEKIPFLLLTASSCVITFLAQRHEAVATLAKVPLSLRLENLPVAYADYLSKIFWPVNLAAFYPLPGTISATAVGVAVAVLVLISAVIWHRRLHSPYLLVGWLWFLGMLVPVIGLVQVGEQALADRYTYFSATGIFIMVTFGCLDLAKRFQLPKIVLPTAAGVILVACLAVTEHQLPFWQNSEALFRRALAVTTDNDTTRLNLGSALEAKGDFDGAMIQYREAIRLNPKSYQAYSNIGKILFELGRPGEALDYSFKAVQTNPGRATLHNNLGIVLAELGRFDEATGEFANAVKLDADYAPPHFQTGKVLLKQGRDAEALPHFQAALKIEPNSCPMLIFVARVLASDENAAARNGVEAVTLAVRLNRLMPQPQPVALDTLAMACAEVGNFDQAQQLQSQAVSLIEAAGQKEDIAAMQHRLELYKNHQPWRASFTVTNASIQP
jgi:protein O-mannosyl-transferase